MAKVIVVLFGEMGSGKSYMGKKIAQANGLDFIEGDDFIPFDMKERTDRFLPPTKQDLRGFVDTMKLSAKLKAIDSKNGIVLSQALYVNEHREELMEYWKKFGYDVDMLWVKVGFWRNLKQLWSRPKGLRWIIYWLISKPFFQKPKHPCINIAPVKGK